MLNAEQLNFDDKTYAEILKEAMEQLPLLNGRWTDYNTHDPGITFLELFSWLTESQRYYLNEITQQHKQKYLKLLGITPHCAEPARLPVVFEAVDTVLKKGEQTVIGGIPFVLEEEITLKNFRTTLRREIDGEEVGAYGFCPFGNSPREGNCFYICFDNTPHEFVRFFVEIMSAEDYKRMPITDEYHQLARLRFDVKCGNEWLECSALDKTYGFMQSGEISIELPKKGMLLRCTLCDCEIDIPPMLKNFYSQYAELVQYNVIYGGEELAGCGHVIATLRRKDDGWVDDSAKKAERIIFADAPYREKVFSVVNNRIMLDTKPLNIISENFALLVLESDGIYREWSAVEDLSCSSPSDRHYELDGANGTIFFGDNIHGMSAESVIIASMRLSVGSVEIKKNHEFTVGKVKAFNPLPSYLGRGHETTKEAFVRYNNERKSSYRAVTGEDYKKLVMQTPGLCIENVNVFSTECGVVNLCVNAVGGRLTEKYIRNIRKQIFGRRLPCIEVRIIPPVLWEGTYYARILPEAWAINKGKEIAEFIEQFFNSLEKIFGLTISLSEWKQELERCPFIQRVQELSLKGRSGITVSENEEITLPQDGLLRITKKEIIMGKQSNG